MRTTQKYLWVSFAIVAILIACAWFFGARYVSLPFLARAATANMLPLLTVPPGYQIDFFAPPSLNLQSPRQLAEGADGWIFAGSRSGNVYALRDNNGDGSADEVRIVNSKLNIPHGVAFADGDLYIGATDGVYVARDIINKLNDGNAVDAEILISGFVNNSWHGTRHLRISAARDLYVSLGTPCDICMPPDAELTGVIRRYSLNGDNGVVYANGIRNSVGFDFHPQTDELWFTDNGRDWMGDDLPSDELNHAPRPGLHFGYPYCHQGDVADPKFGGNTRCADYEPPMQKTGAHVGNLGMSFDAAGQHIYIALHGSWNRSSKVGYAVYRATLDDNAQINNYAPFVEGWLRPDESVLGRPVDVIFTANGDMLISDDFTHVIYRVRKIS